VEENFRVQGEGRKTHAATERGRSVLRGIPRQRDGGVRLIRRGHLTFGIKFVSVAATLHANRATKDTLAFKPHFQISPKKPQLQKSACHR